jgi:hypothetical protein
MSSAVPNCAVFSHSPLLLHAVIARAEMWKLLVVGGGSRLHLARAHALMCYVSGQSFPISIPSQVRDVKKKSQ